MANSRKSDIFGKLHSDRYAAYLSLRNTLAVFSGSMADSTLKKYLFEIISYDCDLLNCESIQKSISLLHKKKNEISNRFNLLNSAINQYKTEHSKLLGAYFALVNDSVVRYNTLNNTNVTSKNIMFTEANVDYVFLKNIAIAEERVRDKIIVAVESYFSIQLVLKCIKYLTQLLNRRMGRLTRDLDC